MPAILTLLGVSVEDSTWQMFELSQQRQRTLDAVKHLLLRESQVQPLLLVFEDLHWIDTETQLLLDSLVESLPTTQILFLINYRPEYEHTWSNKTYYTQLRLDPLPPETAEELLQELLGTDTSLESLKSLLVDRSEGNPFFLEESVRSIVETQVLVGERGNYHLVQELSIIQMPDTVEAMLTARIDRLPPEEKRLLQLAAAVGSVNVEVPFSLLHAIAELPEEVLHRSLGHLQATEFLYQTNFFPEFTYTFKHALIQEAAYQSLLKSVRQQYYQRIAQTLVEQFPDTAATHLEALAYHYTEAGFKASKLAAYC